MRSLNISFVLAVAFGFCLAVPTPENQLAIASNQEFSLHLLHLNDAHGYVKPANGFGARCKPNEKCYGGWARISGMIKKLSRPATKTSPRTLVLDAGDEGAWKTGTDFWNYLKMSIVPDYLNAAGIDVWTVGNHDFDAGEASLKEAIGKFSFYALGANVKSTVLGDSRKKSADTMKPAKLDKLEPYAVFPEHKLIVIGVTTPRDRSKGLSETTTFADPIDTAESIMVEIKKNKKYSGFKIIALSHIGYEDDLKLAREVKGISIIIGAHSHTGIGGMNGGPGNKLKGKDGTTLKGVPYPELIDVSDGRKVCVVQAGFVGRYLGELTPTWKGNQLVRCVKDPKAKNWHELGDDAPVDEKMVTMIDKWSEDIQARRVKGEIHKEYEGWEHELSAEERARYL